jgi:hypothetical protein
MGPNALVVAHPMLGIPIVNPVEAANISDQLSAAGFLNGLA